MNKTQVINFFGGPNTGKSTRMGETFSKLKKDDVAVEMAPEYAKEMVWQEETPNILNNQIHIFGVQQNRIHRLLGKVDVVVTDAPLMNSILYDSTGNEHFHKLVYNQFKSLNNINILLERTVGKYETYGRMHDEKSAKEIDEELKEILADYSIPYYRYLMDVDKECIFESVYENLPDLKRVDD